MPKDSVRVNVNAAILRGDKILLIEFRDENGVHYNLPGGGLDVGETIEEGLKRECLEEASVHVEVEGLILAWEYVPEKLNNRYGKRQKVGLVFLCHLAEGSEPEFPSKPDKNQIGVRWVSMNEFETLPSSKRPVLYPKFEKQLFEAIKNKKSAIPVWIEA